MFKPLVLIALILSLLSSPSIAEPPWKTRTIIATSVCGIILGAYGGYEVWVGRQALNQGEALMTQASSLEPEAQIKKLAAARMFFTESAKHSGWASYSATSGAVLLSVAAALSWNTYLKLRVLSGSSVLYITDIPDGLTVLVNKKPLEIVENTAHVFLDTEGIISIEVFRGEVAVPLKNIGAVVVPVEAGHHLRLRLAQILAEET